MILQPGDIAVDYSYARPSIPAMAAAGVKLVVRYDSPNRAHPKNLTRPEANALHAGGLAVGRVFENAATDPLKGAPLGEKHGTMAREHAIADDYPPAYHLIAAVDFDVQPAQMGTVMSYLQAFHAAAAPYPTGTYGKDTVITAAALTAGSTLGWQTVAWSHKQISPHAHCLQHATPVHPAVPLLGAVDDNTVLKTFKAWSTVPDPLPPQPPQEIDVPAFCSNKTAGKYGAAPSPQGGCTIWELVRNAKSALSFEAWIGYGQPYGEALDDWVLDGIPDYVPIVIPPIVVPPLTGHIAADLGAGGHITGSIG